MPLFGRGRDERDRGGRDLAGTPEATGFRQELDKFARAHDLMHRAPTLAGTALSVVTSPVPTSSDRANFTSGRKLSSID